MYYRLAGNSATLTTYTNAINETQESLISGIRIDEEEEDLPYVYRYHDPAGNPLADFFEGDSIMSKRMYEMLSECGADNIQTFPLEFIDQETRQTRDDYLVYNIIGLVECARLDEAEKLPLGGGFYFHNLVLDPKKTRDLLMFRLKESLTDIIVHETVAKKLRENEIRGIILTPASNG